MAKVDETISGGGKARKPLAEHFRRLVCFCRLTEVPEGLKAASSSSKAAAAAKDTKHQRGVFLFNDVLVVTKSVAGNSKSKARHQYRAALQLAELRVNVFSIAQYQFGLQLQDRCDKVLLRVLSVI